MTEKDKPLRLLGVSDKDFIFFSNHSMSDYFDKDSRAYSIKDFLKSKVNGLTEKMYSEWESLIIKIKTQRR